MADRSIAANDTLNKLRFEFNGTAEDIVIFQVLQMQVILSLKRKLMSLKLITTLNTDLTTISTDNHVFSNKFIIFETQLMIVLKQL